MTDQALQRLAQFDLNGADVYLWVFKRSSGAAKYTASYVRTDQTLELELRRFAETERERITEWMPYGHLAQPTENGCLAVMVDDTDFYRIKDLVDRPEMEHAVAGLDRLKGSTGYLVKFVNEGGVLYAVRRSPTTWKTAYKKKGVINTIFRDGELCAVEGVDFTIEPGFDLFAIDGELIIVNKRAFETIMQYRAGYQQAFGHLQQIPEFVGLFTTMAPLVAYVGTNGTHLRRMAVIQDRALFANPDYLVALRQVCEKRKWPIQFNPAGRIIPTPDTAGIIMKLLLDHRLISEITQIMYDVPDGTPV